LLGQLKATWLLSILCADIGFEVDFNQDFLKYEMGYIQYRHFIEVTSADHELFNNTYGSQSATNNNNQIHYQDWTSDLCLSNCDRSEQDLVCSSGFGYSSHELHAIRDTMGTNKLPPEVGCIKCP
jgi:hypothetical protein